MKHWFVCDRHKKRWSPGTNMFSYWQALSPSERGKNWYKISGYEEVDMTISLSLREVFHGTMYDYILRWLAQRDRADRILNPQDTSERNDIFAIYRLAKKIKKESFEAVLMVELHKEIIDTLDSLRRRAQLLAELHGTPPPAPEDFRPYHLPQV